MLMGPDAGRGVAAGGGVVGCAIGSGWGLTDAGGALRVVVPRRRVCATDVVESVSKRINARAPRAVFIQNSLFLSG